MAVLWLAFVLGSHWYAAMAGCARDTSYCADSRHKDGVYTGVLVGRDGPAGRVDFSMTFESRRPFGRGSVNGFTTRSDGSFCVVWGQEDVIPAAIGESTGEYAGWDISWRPLRDQDPPADCQTSRRGIPWHRALDYATSPQYLLVLLLGGAGIAAIVAGATMSAVRQMGLALTGATTVTAFAVWFLP